MRYRSTTSRSQTRPPSKDRWRLWMLVGALGLVLAVMRQLDKPATVERLDQLFGAAQQEQSESPSDQTLAEIAAADEGSNHTLHADSIVQPGESFEEMVRGGVDLSAVRDKTYFRPEERPAWFSLFGQLQKLNESQLANQTVGELTYVQLLQQPEVYRGRVVSIRGTVLREERQPLKDNPLGLDEYHCLWIQPEGGGHWPIVAYCLRLPSGFPRGDAIRATVRVDGYFFKNWSYPWDDGLGLAPVVLADQPLWQPPPARAVRQQSSRQSWAIAIAIALAVSISITWLALSRTKRRKIRPEQEKNIRRQFSHLAKEDKL